MDALANNRVYAKTRPPHLNDRMGIPICTSINRTRPLNSVQPSPHLQSLLHRLSISVLLLRRDIRTSRRLLEICGYV